MEEGALAEQAHAQVKCVPVTCWRLTGIYTSAYHCRPREHTWERYIDGAGHTPWNKEISRGRWGRVEVKIVAELEAFRLTVTSG